MCKKYFLLDNLKKELLFYFQGDLEKYNQMTKNESNY